ncbi:MAG: hypothetical protein HYY30_04670 [Chloroflexi bacterium]|nr:hypothetical protein [Chloroflexota bacterium]
MKNGAKTTSHARFKPVALFVCAIAVVAPFFTGYSPQFPNGSNAPPVPLRTVPNTDVNPFGANFFLHWEAEDWKVDKTLEMAREAGLGWVKQQFPWEDIELKKGVFWDDRLNKSTWEKYDRIVALSEKYGLKIIARLDRPPDWTRKDNSLKEAPPDNLQDYADFVEAVVSRYKGRILYYQLWNEPNIWPEWGNQSIEPGAYVALLRAGNLAAKGADPNVYVLSAPLAQTIEQSPRAMPDTQYLDEMYKNGARDYFDILFANAYGFSLPPDDAPDPGVLNFERVLLLRDIMLRNGDAQKSVWFNEFGWTAPPAGFPAEKLIWGKVTEQQQAEYTIAAIRKARADWPWAGVFSIWYFRQDGHIPSDRADYYFRMVDVGFTPRQLYNSVKAEAANAARVAVAGDYQETNPAVTADKGWQVSQDVRASGGSLLASESAGSNITIAFRGTEIALTAVRGPRAGIVYVSVDGGEVGNLPRDQQGRSYLDLYSPTEQWQASINIAEGLSDVEHKLRIVVSPARNREAQDSLIAIDGFSVRENPSWWWLGTASIAVAVLIAIVLMAAGRGSRKRRETMK